PCQAVQEDGFWEALVIRKGGGSSPLQLGLSLPDQTNRRAYPHVIGLYLGKWQRLDSGDRVRFVYHGHIPRRATAWTSRPFRPNFRFRTFTWRWGEGLTPGPWRTLDDSEVDPLEILPDREAAFIRTIAPLDLEVGVPFRLAVVVTDRYGNPRPITGRVQLREGVSGELVFADEWRKEVEAVYATPGDVRVIAEFPGTRSLYHTSRVWASPPPYRQLLGDIHFHTGDGGAQRKFLGAVSAGDHAALSSRMIDAYRYLEKVAGFDFAAASEHAVRDAGYTLPPSVAQDPEFSQGGRCWGEGKRIEGLGDWWRAAQATGKRFRDEISEGLIVFPAFEWHSLHANGLGDRSRMHRVVLFRDFDAQDRLPILPGDVGNLPPQCLIRFLDLVGFGPESVLVVPHMMVANDTNIDWDLTYADSS
ncbi:MAG: hypothetical protein D6812_05970, partial [Deltaproteobacteria bacterium]